MKRPVLIINLVSILFLGLLFRAIPTLAEHGDYSACEGVRRIMAMDVPAVPYLSPDYDAKGEFLVPDIQNQYNFSALNSDGSKTNNDEPLYAHVFAFYVNKADSTLHLSFDAPDFPLEYALFQGVLAQPNSEASNYSAFAPIQTRDEVSIHIVDVDYYTLVVRRANMDVLNSGTFYMEANFETDPSHIPDDVLAEQWVKSPNRDVDVVYSPAWNSASINYLNPPQYVQANLNGFYQIIETTAIPQIFFRRGGNQIVGRMFFGDWVERVSLVGGSLAVQGVSNSRFLFLSDFVPSNGTDESVQGSNDILSGLGRLGTLDNYYGRLDTDWQNIEGIWVLDHCLGVLFDDKHTFIASLPENRPYEISLMGGLQEFNAQLQIPNATNDGVERLSLKLDWSKIADKHEVNIDNATLRTRLKSGQDIELETVNIDISKFETDNSVVRELTKMQLDGTLEVLLDGQTLSAFYYRPLDNRIELIFKDSRSAENLPNPSRETKNLSLFESFDRVIRLKYNDANGDADERLWLPEEYGYIELQTPGQSLNYDPKVLPNADNYVPTALNNLGNECYTANTLLADIACVHDSIVNYANGNLWYAVTDLQAYGSLIDLMLTRSYNSYNFERDSAFGYGWTSEFLLDYKELYSKGDAARVIDQAAMQNYRVGLDVLYSPHGFVMYQTPSGSQHLFKRDTDTKEANELGMDIFRTETMPDWILYRRGETERERVRASWILRQEDSFTVEFDTAGRIKWYGYPDERAAYDSPAYLENGRIVQIDYAANLLDGIKGQTVAISDNAASRYLEFQYDDNYHVISATLHDKGQSASDDCSSDNACQQTSYHYENGQLVEVNYADGTTAHYSYLDGRLNLIDDPRASFSQELEISYRGDSTSPRVEKIEYKNDDGETLPWLTIVDDDKGRVRVTKGDGESESTYVYCFDDCDVKENYTLVSYSGPLLEEVHTRNYTWEDGRLSNISSDNRANYAALQEANRLNNDVFKFTGSFAPLLIDKEVIEQDGIVRVFAGSKIDLGDGTSYDVDYGDNHIWPVRIIDNAGATYVFERDPKNYYEVTKVSLYSSPEAANDPLVLPELYWVYHYNDLGLVTEVTRFVGQDASDNGYTTHYEWDNLGQLRGITQGAAKSVDTNPDKHIAINRFVRQIERSYTEIHLVDELSTSVYCFDERSRLVDEVLVKGQFDDTFSFSCQASFAQFEQRTSYYYDALDRLTAESVWTDDVNQPELRTSYDYTPAKSLSAIGDSPASEISGYQLVVTEPEVDGQIQAQTVYIYDALNRLREVRDVFSHITRYDYNSNAIYNEGADLDNPRIIQRDFWDNNLISRTEYFMDSSNQLRGVKQYPNVKADSSQPIEWKFLTRPYENAPNKNIEHVTEMTMANYPINIVRWNGSDDGHNLSVTIPQARAGLGVNPQVAVTYDYLQRPILYHYARQDGESFEQIIYCSLADGKREEIYRNRSSIDTTVNLHVNDTDCKTNDFDKRLLYDGQNRLEAIAFGDGRTLEYSYAIVNRETVVTLTDTSSGGTGLQSEYHYNIAGFLTEWTDSSGIHYDYELDTLGRLLLSHVEKADKLLEETRYKYNEANQVVQESDTLNNSQLSYFYNQQGLLTSIRDKTGNVTTYAYDRFGRLTTVITPLGRTVTYGYDEDFLDIHRPVEIITGGVSYQLDWQDRQNCLLVTNPQGFTMAYVYDMVGLLRNVAYLPEDSTNCNERELLATLTYDDTGVLNGWYVGDSIEGAERAFAIKTDSQNGITVSAASGSNKVWEWRTKYDVDGNLLELGNKSLRVGFDYDAFSHLNQILPLSSGGDLLLWKFDYSADASLSYQNSQNEAFTISYDNHFNWIRSNELGMAYERIVYKDDIVYRFEQDGVQYYYQFVAANADDVSQQTIIYLHAPGQTRQYSYDVEGHLVGITTQICSGEIQFVDKLDPDPCLQYRDSDSAESQSESVSEEDDKSSVPTIWETKTVIEYNAQGLPFRIAENDLVETFAYDALGNITLYQDTSGRTFRYRYDEYNRLIRLESPANLVIVLEYAADERPVAICLSNSFEVSAEEERRSCVGTSEWLESYSYDVLGRPSSRTYPVTSAGSLGKNTIDYQYENARSGKASAVGPLDFDYLDMLGRLNLIQLGQRNYDLDYDGLNQLSQINHNHAETIIQYGEQPNSIDLSLGGLDNVVANVEYSEDLNTIEVISGNHGQRLQLNASGFVELVATLNRGEISDLARITYVINPDGDYFQPTINWSNVSLREGATTYWNDSHQQLAFVNNLPEYVLGYSLTSTGQVQSQRVLSDYLSSTDNGYTIQMGYDEVGRPLTMQITDSDTGEPLYLLSLSHDSFGRIVQETRQYLLEAQNKLVEIKYSYAEGNLSQLISSELKVREISNDLLLQFGQGAAYAFAPLVLLGFFYSYRRRSRLMLILASIAMLGTVTVLVGAQETGEQTSYDYTYQYDDNGNLKAIMYAGEPCVAYEYDSANRLIGNQSQRANYTYTANNQLERIYDNYLLYYDDQKTPALAYNSTDGTLSLLGNLLPDVPLYQQNLDTGELRTLYSNGLGEILAYAEQDDTVANDNLWLFDPLGRLINLEWSANMSDPCSLFTMDNANLDDLMPQLSFNGMIWDSKQNLMFDGARAYNPILGRFLQRNPTGPDVMGNSYTYYPAPPAPPIAKRDDTMFESGLQVLQKFQTDATITQTLSSTAIWERHAPVPIGYHVDSFYQDFSASSEHVQAQVQNMLALSERLLSHFRPQARLDADGTIRFYNPVAANNPQTATMRSFVNPATTGQAWLPSKPQSAAAHIEAALSLLNYTDYRFRITEPQAWRPQSFSLGNIWIEPRPKLSYIPNITDYLLKALNNPLLGLQTLQAAEMISEFPNHDAVWWIERAINNALPAFPELPPNSVEDWREQWFDKDVLGNAAIYDTAWPSLDYPSIPNYSWGTNWNGPDPDIDH